jgi:type I restriction enzyme M protein
LFNVIDRVGRQVGEGPHLSFNAFMDVVEADAEKNNVKLTTARKKLLKERLAKRDDAAAEVISKVHKPGKVKSDPLRGLFEITLDGKSCVVEYEADTELRDTEQIPLLEEGGIEAFIRREVLPHVPDAWYEAESVKIGYEISFTRYFYKPHPLRSLEEIRADILALEKETEGLLSEIIGGGH